MLGVFEAEFGPAISLYFCERYHSSYCYVNNHIPALTHSILLHEGRDGSKGLCDTFAGIQVFFSDQRSFFWNFGYSLGGINYLYVLFSTSLEPPSFFSDLHLSAIFRLLLTVPSSRRERGYYTEIGRAHV